jgi:hypothetical protein
MVDEMRIMQMNILRWKAVHNLLFGAEEEAVHNLPFGAEEEAGYASASLRKRWNWLVPSNLEDFENETKWTHVLSARSVSITHIFDSFSYDMAVCAAAPTERSQMKTLRCGTGSKEMNGLGR